MLVGGGGGDLEEFSDFLRGEGSKSQAVNNFHNSWYDCVARQLKERTDSESQQKFGWGFQGQKKNIPVFPPKMFCL